MKNLAFPVLSLLSFVTLAGCTASPEADLAFRKLMVGYDGLTCSEAYSERLKDGETQETAQANYEVCIGG